MKLFTIHLIYRSELWGAFTLATGQGEMENTIIDIKMIDRCIKVVNSSVLTDNHPFPHLSMVLFQLSSRLDSVPCLEKDMLTWHTCFLSG